MDAKEVLAGNGDC